ncbi:hypothetical protein BDV93DRAFT_521614 [Ceratobasidium sp. AG-I]|nr:hypothetical protein BDV93DRAFT_521614 [Ceratobasidium sp. AG-I]
MCNRILRFICFRECGHNELTKESMRDCRLPKCAFSSQHSPTCVPPACRCQRYYTPPDRMVTGDTVGKCTACKRKTAPLVIT